jgi:hypothetical protein
LIEVLADFTGILLPDQSEPILGHLATFQSTGTAKVKQWIHPVNFCITICAAKPFIVSWFANRALFHSSV